ncbi:hypothetical protein BDEG_24274 [Batrachochytrium dendrobatidis JEL423]|uniref:DUF155 domain-containing protein n=1 Tax=Batrachochytrium dendrobatidis (strain JEL423) TaxID=403673 RepID=A0A177WL72_BATDL|nr:hypothetical protein BDEG_24274 [Batrachochytrium dendrobatidis JEL423]
MHQLRQQKIRHTITTSQHLTNQKNESETKSNRMNFSQAPIMDDSLVRRAVLAKKKKSVRDIRSEDEFPSGPYGMISAPATQPERVTAFSTAERYDCSVLFGMLQKHYQILPYMADDIYRVRLTEPLSQDTTQKSNYSSQKHSNIQTSEGIMVNIADPTLAEAFFFSSGTFVTWGATDEQNELILAQVRDCEINRYSNVETEWFDYFYDFNQLRNDHPLEQAKLAYSAGLARSVKLASLEMLLEGHLNKNRGIPEILLKGRRLPVGRAAILRNLGELFSLRAHVNLNSELLDNPDFCWSSRRMEEYFDRISRSLDVRPRIAVFNKRLDYANEVAEVLRNHLHEQHSLKLEWCIIILISVEIAFECVHFLSRAA